VLDQINDRRVDLERRRRDIADALRELDEFERRCRADLEALRQEVAGFSGRIRNLPGFASLMVAALVTALLTAAIVVALQRYGLPGVLPR